MAVTSIQLTTRLTEGVCCPHGATLLLSAVESTPWASDYPGASSSRLSASSSASASSSEIPASHP